MLLGDICVFFCHKPRSRVWALERGLRCQVNATGFPGFTVPIKILCSERVFQAHASGKKKKKAKISFASSSGR